MTAFHIDKNVKILTGDDARQALASENDAEFVTEDQGIVRVPEKRWDIAQHAEKIHWMKLGIKSIDDRNDYHVKEFDSYRSISQMTFRSAIELGCGPFTNLRIIGTACRIESCSLLDPLIEEYLSHPNCTYDREKLLLARHLSKRTLLNRILGKYFTGFYNGLRKKLNPFIKVDRLIALPIEKMPTGVSYDLVCIINVIEHCYDIELVFSNILKVMKKGSIVIFNDRYYDGEEVRHMVKDQYDAAHPLKVGKARLDAFLSQNFETVYQKVKANRAQAKGLNESVSFEEIYFIGRKLS